MGIAIYLIIDNVISPKRTPEGAREAVLKILDELSIILQVPDRIIPFVNTRNDHITSYFLVVLHLTAHICPVNKISDDIFS